MQGSICKDFCEDEYLSWHVLLLTVLWLLCSGLEDKPRQLLRTVSEAPNRTLPPARRTDEGLLPVSSSAIETAGAGMV